MMASAKSILSTILIAALLSGCMVPVLAPRPQAPLPDLGSGPLTSHTRGNKSPYVVFDKTYTVMPSSLGYVEIGIASWYGKKFHGRLTSNGEVYDMYQVTAAHKALPLPSIVRVTNLDNGRKVIVRVNDRGPFHSDRVIDLSYATALQLGFAEQGTAPVVVEAIDAENYPDQAVLTEHQESFYLQVGAFSKITGAEQLLATINDLMVLGGYAVDARILQSEIAETILHKVWLGPIGTTVSRDEIAQLVQDRKLGTPIQVKVE